MHYQHSSKWLSATTLGAALAAMIGAHSVARASAENTDPATPGTIACCLNTADQQGCTDLLPADCAAAGGVDAGAGKTCDPDPCPGQGGSPDGQAEMPGDCNGDHQVTIDEMVVGVKIAMGAAPVAACPAADSTHDGRVDVGELVQMVKASLNGQSTAEPSDTPTPGTIACCLNTADEQGCSDLLPADCAAAGGVQAATGTCDPDPCPNAGTDNGVDGGAGGDAETAD